ncbi:MAG: hypothetical protein AB7O43_10425 [Hyphomicrobiaceae bacterium]
MMKKKAAKLPPLRVKNEPPTMEEAMLAAEGMSTDLKQQVEIAAMLLGLEASDEGTAKALIAARPRGKTVEVGGHGRAARSVVVVERKTRARVMAPRGAGSPKFSAAAR